MQKFEAPIDVLDTSKSDFIGPRLTSMARLRLRFLTAAKESPVRLRLATDEFLRTGGLQSDETLFISLSGINRSSVMTIVRSKARLKQSKDHSFILHDMELPFLDNPVTHKDNQNG